MTVPIIPADQWPEGAVALVWSAFGLGKWIAAADNADNAGIWVVERADIPMPEGWDWRVPVMRPVTGTKGGEQIADIVAEWEAGTCGPFKSMKRIKEHLDSLTFQPGNDLHIGYEAGMRLAKLAAPQQSPAIDLEQFRMIAQGSVDALTQNKVYPADVSAAIGSMRQLLALIDGQGVGEGPQKGRCPNNAAPGGCQLPNRFCTFPSCDKADDLQPAACPRCKGTGEADSGGIMPWGAPATIPCDCQQPAAVTQSDSGAVSNASAPVGVEGLMQLAREWCMSWGEWAHDADPGCAKENAAEAVLRAALTQALAQQPSKGEGE